MAAHGLPRVRILRPTLWCAASVATIYVGSAAYELHRDATLFQSMARQTGKEPPDVLTIEMLNFSRNMIGLANGLGGLAAGPLRQRPAPSPGQGSPLDNLVARMERAQKGLEKDAASLDELLLRAEREGNPEVARKLREAREAREAREVAARDSPSPTSSVTQKYERARQAREQRLGSQQNERRSQMFLPETSKLLVGIAATNVGVFGLERLVPSLSVLFSHIPALNTNYSLLTSAFGHVGFFHLALNMYGLYQFLPPVAKTPTFNYSASHLASFYLSAGILSSLAHHLATVWPRPLDRMIAARGASGAVMAVVGAFGVAYPNHQLGIILIPGSLPASQFLWLLAAFETYGLFRGFKRLPLAHAAHLAGLAIGAGYVYFDGQKRVWQPVRRFTFAQMQRLSLI
ncbi:hypothetical protein SEUCBS140593_010388 [Sporothrix eucalyptigena]|uniref:Peptidase S54 rhomboid domain-containing protein n=1 Tax=Sporothrix eucalyptigena TaxID=1812306 RepID=A0ABP0D176_9PEZI